MFPPESRWANMHLPGNLTTLSSLPPPPPQHIADAARLRAHEQMVSQIARTERWLD
jgi:hypothetical protein